MWVVDFIRFRVMALILSPVSVMWAARICAHHFGFLTLKNKKIKKSSTINHQLPPPPQQQTASEFNNNWSHPEEIIILHKNLQHRRHASGVRIALEFELPFHSMCDPNLYTRHRFPGNLKCNYQRSTTTTTKTTTGEIFMLSELLSKLHPYMTRCVGSGFFVDSSVSSDGFNSVPVSNVTCRANLYTGLCLPGFLTFTK